MKFVDKNIQEDFDSIPEERKQEFKQQFLLRNPHLKHKVEPQILKVKQWLKNRQTANTVFFNTGTMTWTI